MSFADVCSGTIGGDAPPSGDAAIATWQRQMQGAEQKIRDKYAGAGPYTVRAVLADVDHWWQIATQFFNEAPSVSTMLPARVKQAGNNATNLLEARAQLRAQSPTATVSPASLAVYVDAMTAPIEWLLAVGRAPLEADAPSGRFPWKFAIYTAGAVGVLWAVSKALSSTAEVKREFLPPVAPAHAVAVAR